MRLAKIIRSTPVKHFDATVCHSTPRQSTPLEWFITGAVQVIQERPEFANVSIQEFISRIAEVSDVNELIKNCINNLMDVGALEMDASIIADDSDLSQIPMSQLKITESGRKIHQEEILPGALSYESVKVDLDIFTGELTFHDKENKYDSSCKGINICAHQDYQNTPLPSVKVSELLQKDQLQKEPKISWLKADSKIHEIQDNVNTIAEESISWVNTHSYLNISGNGVVDADMDESMINMVLDRLDSNDGPKAVKCTINFDKDVKQVASIKETGATIQELMLNSRIYVCNYNQLKAPVKILRSSGNSKDSKILINYGKEPFALNYDADSKSLQINVPSSDETSALLGSVIFATEKCQLNCNTIDISVGNTSREMELNYVPTVPTFSTNDFLLDLVKKHGTEHRILLNLPIMIRQTPLFYKMAYEMGNAEKGLKNRVQFLREVAESNKIYVERSYLSPTQDCEILFDNWIEGELSTQEAYNLMKELDGESYIKNHPDRMKGGFNKLLDHWNTREDIDIFWEIIKIASKTQSMQNHIASPAIIAQLYTDQFLEQLFAKFGQIPPDIKAFHPTEIALLEMQKAYAKFCNKMNSIGFKKDQPEDERHTIALNHPAAIQELHSMIKDLNRLHNKLEDHEKNLDDYMNQGYPQFFNMVMTLKEVSQWLANYLGADIADFEKVYVADTSALMRHPELTDKFQHGRHALVIPARVIEELDGLKESSNNLTAKKARDAIKTVHAALQKSWCKTEQSHPELLPPDYPEDENGEKNGDNLILSTALHFWGHKPILLTGDINFANKAISTKISYKMSDDFVKMTDKENRKH